MNNTIYITGFDISWVRYLKSKKAGPKPVKFLRPILFKWSGVIFRDQRSVLKFDGPFSFLGAKSRNNYECLPTLQGQFNSFYYEREKAGKSHTRGKDQMA
jgi:hypothetical protein